MTDCDYWYCWVQERVELICEHHLWFKQSQQQPPTTNPNGDQVTESPQSSEQTSDDGDSGAIPVLIGIIVIFGIALLLAVLAIAYILLKYRLMNNKLGNEPRPQFVHGLESVKIESPPSDEMKVPTCNILPHETKELRSMKELPE